MPETLQAAELIDFQATSFTSHHLIQRLYIKYWLGHCERCSVASLSLTEKKPQNTCNLLPASCKSVVTGLYRLQTAVGVQVRGACGWGGKGERSGWQAASNPQAQVRQAELHESSTGFLAVSLTFQSSYSLGLPLTDSYISPHRCIFPPHFSWQLRLRTCNHVSASPTFNSLFTCISSAVIMPFSVVLSPPLSLLLLPFLSISLLPSSLSF